MRDIEGIDEVVERLKPHWAAIDAHFDSENQKFKAFLSIDHDIIGRVLKCHLILENYLERNLGAILDPDHLKDARLSFHQKATLLPTQGAASAFVRPGILKLNSIRNQFGHTLQPVLAFRDLGPINEVLQVARPKAVFKEPIDAIEAFTTVACTWLIVPPPNLQVVFQEAFQNVQSREP